MSGTYPSSPGFTAIGFRTKTYSLSSETISGRVQVRSIGGSRFEFSVSYPPMTASVFNPVNAFIMAQQGQFETFQITLPQISEKSGTATGSVEVNEANGGAIGDTTVAIDGLTGEIKAGDMIKFAGHSKVYMVTTDRSGNGNLTFHPPLLSTVANDEDVIYDDVPFTVRLANKVQEFGVNVSKHVAYEVDFIEAI